MSKNVIRYIKIRAYWFSGIQAILVIVAAFLTGLLFNSKIAYSLLLGGAVSVIPTLYFTRKLFVKTHARDAKAIIKAFYVGEIIKLTLMGLLFVAIIKSNIVAIVPFVLGFVLAQVAAFIAPVVYSIGEYKSHKI